MDENIDLSDLNLEDRKVDDFRVGMVVTLPKNTRVMVDRDFMYFGGQTGIITNISPDEITIELHKKYKELDEWDNTIVILDETEYDEGENQKNLDKFLREAKIDGVDYEYRSKLKPSKEKEEQKMLYKPELLEFIKKVKYEYNTLPRKDEQEDAMAFMTVVEKYSLLGNLEIAAEILDNITLTEEEIAALISVKILGEFDKYLNR